MTVLLRPGRTSDLPHVGDLHFRSRADAYRDFLAPSSLEFGAGGALAEWWTERWKWEQPTHRLTVATLDDELVGFTYLGPSEEPGAVELSAIHVDPAHLGTGVGKLLMQDAVPHLAPRGLLWVLAQNTRARHFYERGGWHPDGTTRTAPLGTEQTEQLRYTLTGSVA